MYANVNVTECLTAAFYLLFHYFDKTNHYHQCSAGHEWPPMTSCSIPLQNVLSKTPMISFSSQLVTSCIHCTSCFLLLVSSVLPDLSRHCLYFLARDWQKHDRFCLSTTASSINRRFCCCENVFVTEFSCPKVVSSTISCSIQPSHAIDLHCHW